MSKPIKIIEEIRDGQLCTGCGTCAGVCPTGAIKIAVSGGVYLPVTEEQKCISCGLCVASCPGHSVDFNDLNERFFGHQPDDFSFGNFLKCYVGHSNHFDVRYQAASGGLASQLLITALEMGLIDGALVVRMKSDRPLETEAFIAKTKEEILSASKSKYCPVASNEILNQILNKNQRIAVVGLPCHIHGIRKAEAANRKLKEKIVLHIGLMCSHCVNFAGTELVLEKLGINRDNVTDISYRGYGWPGGLKITLKDGSRKFIPLFGTWNSYWSLFSSYLFTPPRCLMCPDHTAELADISLGDAWFPELGHDKVGRSVIVTRTKTAEDFVSSVASVKAISLVEISAEKVKQSQKLLIRFKKDFFKSRLSLLKMFGKQTPSFKMPAPDSSDALWSPTVFVKAFYPFFNSYISLSKKIKPVLKYTPFPLFRLYFGVYKFLSYI
jgi:coenzyme F420 hydrogenase subunit beta